MAKTETDPLRTFGVRVNSGNLIVYKQSPACGNRLELVGVDRIRKRPPAVTISQQHDEIGSRTRVLAAFEFLQADARLSLIQPGFFRDAPAEIDGLEAKACLLAELR